MATVDARCDHLRRVLDATQRYPCRRSWAGPVVPPQMPRSRPLAGTFPGLGSPSWRSATSSPPAHRRSLTEMGEAGRAIAGHLLGHPEVRRRPPWRRTSRSPRARHRRPARRAARRRQARDPAGAAARPRPRLGTYRGADRLRPAGAGCSSRTATTPGSARSRRRTWCRCPAWLLPHRDAARARRGLLRPGARPGAGRNAHLRAALRRRGGDRRAGGAARPAGARAVATPTGVTPLG